MKLEKWITRLQSALLAFLIGYGGCACLYSAFSMQASPTVLGLWCACFAILASVCIGTKLITVLLGFLALLAGYLWHMGTLSLSVEALLYHLSRHYSMAYGVATIRWSGQPLQEADVTAALCALSVITVLLTARTVCRARRAWLPMVFGLLPLCACLVVTDTVPAVGHLFLLLSGLAVLMLTQTTRRKDNHQGNRLTVLVALPTALAVAVLFWANPQQTYSKQYQAEELLQMAQDILSQQFAQGGTAVSKRENLASAGLLSNPHLPVMDVTADNGGVLYLREQVFDTYDGKQWTMKNQYASSRYALSEMRLAGKVRISTRYTFSNLYVPYYALTSQQGTEGYTENPDKLRSYSFDIMALKNPALYHELPSLYATNLPDDTLAWAKALMIPVLRDLPGTAAFPEAIADYVRNSAIYDKQTPRMPGSRTDFVRWFLEESDTGYCVHYASATAVLLQAAGIPARYVTGYMISTEPGKSTTVYMNDAHAWVEFYDPYVGWRILESTPGDGLPTFDDSPAQTQPPTEPSATRPPVQNTTPQMTLPQQTQAADTQSDTKPQLDLKWLMPVLTAAAWVLGVLLLIIGQWQLRRKLIERKLTRGTTNQRAVAAWRQVALLSRLLRQRPDAGLFSLAQKAKFSQHTLTEEELTLFDTYLHNARQQLQSKPLSNRLLYRLVFAAY